MKYILWVVFLLSATPLTMAGEATQPSLASFDLNKMVHAIYLAEGGSRAKKPFGILSVKCSTFSGCERVCRNTIRNNLRRWKKTDMAKDFISFLGERYAPRSDSPLNANWIKNVRYFYTRTELDKIIQDRKAHR